jgi:hypothetical protein
LNATSNEGSKGLEDATNALPSYGGVFSIYALSLNLTVKSSIFVKNTAKLGGVFYIQVLSKLPPTKENKIDLENL